MNEKDIDGAARKVFHTEVEPEGRKMILWTDRKGLELFHKALKEEVSRQNKLVGFHKEESEKTYVADPPNFTAGVYKKMSKEEVKELMYLSLSGYGDGHTIWMGSEAYQKVLDFKNKMVQKYK